MASSFSQRVAALPRELPRHVCPIRGCLISVSNTKLVCGQHWRLVPDAAGDELYAAWRELRRPKLMGLTQTPTERERAILRHRKAMRACIDAVHAALDARKPRLPH